MFSYAHALQVLVLALATFVPAFTAAPAAAAESASASFRNVRSDVNTGGRRKTSASYRDDGTAGSPGKNGGTSASYSGRSGMQSVYHYPFGVTDLFASSAAASTQIYLQWTSPGNDGSEASTPGLYIVRYSSIASESPALNDAKFNAATPVVPAPPAAQVKGSLVTMNVTGLTAGVTYYFAIKTAERDGTRSRLSAGATAQTLAPEGCAVVRNVHKVDGPYTTVQSAVNALPASLPGHSCVIIRDAATYGEQVTVQGFTNNGSSISIFTDPAVGARAAFNPPALSTAAFFVKNSSVNILNLNVTPTSLVQAGVAVSSSHVKLSSVGVHDMSARIWGAGVSLSDWNTVSHTSVTLTGASPAGFALLGSSMTSISYSSAAVNGASAIGLYALGATSNTFTRVFISNAGGAAFQLDTGSRFNAVSQSTVTGNAAGFGALHLSGASTNTFSQTYVYGNAGVALNLQTGSTYNTVSLSTLAANSGSWAAVNMQSASSNTVTDSFIRNTGNNAVYIQASANGNLFRRSTMTINGDFAAFYVWGSSSNTLESSYLQNFAANGNGVFIDVDAKNNRVIGSTSVVAGDGLRGALVLYGASTNTVTGGSFRNTLGHAVVLRAGSIGNVISGSTMTSVTTGFAGLYIAASASNTVSGAYIQGTTATHVSGSTGTVISGSALVATAAAGSALAVTAGSVNLSVASTTLTAGSIGRGLYLDPGNRGLVAVGSVTVSGASRGVEVSTQGAGFVLAVDSITFRGLASGATAIHFLGGTHVATVTLAGFETGTAITNVSGAALDLASRITMRSSSGALTGPGYENDPNSLVDWADLVPPTNIQLWYVALSSAGLQYNTVGAQGYTVQASTRSDFQTGTNISSTVFGTQGQLSVLGLMPNTTYFLRAGALWSGSTSYASTVVSTSTLANLAAGTTVYAIHRTSMVVNWVPLPSAPPDASSKTAQGYVLQVSSMSNFAPVWAASATPNVALSTLTIDTLRGGVTYYFRVGTINHNSVPNFAGAVSTLMPVQLGVEMTTHTISVPGLVNTNTTVLITTSVIFTNTGNVKETYYVRVTTVSVGSPWRAGTTQGSDQYVMSMIVSPTEPVLGNFGAEDKLLDAEQDCAGLRFALGGGNCFQVPVGGTRTLWFKFDSPLATSTVAPQDIQIFARAVRDPDPDPNP